MVNYGSDALDATFTALADPTRRAILAQLTLGETPVSELAQPHAMSLPGFMKHLDVLERAGLLEARKDGRVRRCRLEPAPLSEAAAWLDRYRRFWDERFDALAQYLEGSEEDPWRQPVTKNPSRSASPAPSRRRGRKSSAHGSSRRR